MSFFNKIKILNCNDIINFLSGWNDSEENSILLLLTSNSSITAKNTNIQRIYKIFEDKNIGFIYTDVITINNNIQNIEYLNGIDLPNVPFFAKKINKLNFTNIDNDNIMIGIMKTYLDHGYYFQHLADPLIKINI